MSNSPIVSVCMITYNHEAYISEAIEGVLKQKTNFDVELVIGEDCSSDNTRVICEKYQQKYLDRIRLLMRQKNLGMMPNFIDTLEHCTGKYIALCEGDDYWTDEYKLQRQIDFLEANPEFAVSFHCVEIKSDDVNAERTLSNTNQQPVTSFEDLARTNYIWTPSCVFRREGLALPEWLSSVPVGDWPLHLLNAEKGKIGYLDRVMAVYRIHIGGVWSTKNLSENYIKWIETVKKCRHHFYPRGEDEFAKQLARITTELCFIYYNSGKYRKFRQAFTLLLALTAHTNKRTLLAVFVRYPLSFIPALASYYGRARTTTV